MLYYYKKKNYVRIRKLPGTKEHYKVIKRSIHQEDIAVLCMHQKQSCKINEVKPERTEWKNERNQLLHFGFITHSLSN